MRPPCVITAVVALSVTAAIGGCSKDNGSSAPTYKVDSTDTTCDVEKTDLASGPATFEVSNSGSDVTEVYIYAEGGDFTDIVEEAENIGPGTARSLDVDLNPGQYHVTCKPGMTGDGISTLITVK
ncbi:MAG: cupredoxin domain-containing protein [Nocardioidaceae bacterium]